MLKRIIPCLVLWLLQIDCSRGVETAYLFDCGPQGSPLQSGYTRLTERNLYTPKTGYGWRGLEYKRGISRNPGFPGLPGIFPDSLGVDWVGGAREFALDLPSGSYFVCLMSEDPGDTYYLPRYESKECRIEGESVLNRKFSEAEFYRNVPRFDEATTRDPAEFYDRYVSDRFPIHRFLVQVDDGQLNLEFSGGGLYAFPVNFIAVLKIKSPGAGQDWVERLEARRKEYFIQTFGQRIGEGRFQRVMLPTAREVESQRKVELEELSRAREKRLAEIKRLTGTGDRRGIGGRLESNRSRLSRLLGPIGTDRVTDVERLGPVGSGLYLTETIQLGTASGKKIGLRLSKPRNTSGRLPAALFLPGAGERPAGGAASRLEALRDTSRLAIEVELPSLAGLDVASAKIDLYRGRPTMGSLLGELEMVLGYLSGRPDVSPEQLGLFGYDYGGLLAVLAGALDTRIKVVAAAGAVSDLETIIRRDRVPYHNAALFIPGILPDMDLGDVLACLAPRPLLILAGRYDEVFPMESLTGIWDFISPVYERFDSPERVMMKPFDSVHELTGEMIASADSWFDIWLEPSRIIEVPDPPSRLERIEKEESGPRRSLGIEPGLDRGRWEERRSRLKKVLWDIIGPPDRQIPLQAEALGTEAGDGFRIEQVRYRGDKGLEVDALVLVPESGTPPYPAVVCLGGTEATPRSTLDRYARELPGRGYLAFIATNRCFGGRPDNVFSWARAAVAFGGSYTGNYVKDNIRGIDYLVQRPDVDPERIGVMGNSLGGFAAWILAALDDRVKAAFASSGVSSYQAIIDHGQVNSHSEHLYLTGLYRYAEMYDVIAAIAPRAFLMHNGVKDASYPADGFEETYRRARSAWEIYGEPDGIQMYLSDGGHGMPEEARERAYRMFDRYLKGID